jgi:membrane fusion protein, copper/silver efflux system
MKRTIIFAAVLAGFLSFLCRTEISSAKENGSLPSPVVSGPVSEPQGDTRKDVPAGGVSPVPAETPQQVQGDAEVPTVEIPAEKQQLIGVKTVEVSVMPMQSLIRSVGRIEYDERRLFTINTKVAGWVEKLFVNVTGDPVRKGQALAEIYSPELFATQQEFINTLRWARQNQVAGSGNLQGLLAGDAERMVEAAKQRLRLWDISAAQIRTIAATGKPIRTLVITSQVNGVIIQKPVLQGMRVMPGEKLFDIADLSTVWLVADLYESQLSLVSIGQKVTIALSNFPGQVFSSSIDFISPTLAGETRTARVRCTIPNPGGSLKPQMFTTIEIKTDPVARLAVPDDAVIDTGRKKVVYVDKGLGMFEPREVTTGMKTNGLTEILAGLAPGEKVASAANFLIDSEAQLKGVTPLSGPAKP